MRLADLTTVEVRRAIELGAIGLIPVGATEAHGPHLPLDTDVIIAEETCRRAALRVRASLGLEALVLPAVTYSLTDYASPFSGTVSIPKAVVVPYLTEIAVSASRSGYRALCFVNGHLEPGHRHALRDAGDAARERARCPVVIADPCDRKWVPRLTEEFQRGACHAGQYETSLLLAAGARVHDPSELPDVDIDLMAGMKAGLDNFADMGATDAYFGCPARATREEGEASFTVLADIVFEVVRDAAGPQPQPEKS